MERRNFLRLLPLAAVSPKIIKDGVVSLELPGPGHYVIVCDRQKVNVSDLSEYPSGLLPAGSTGGWIICVDGNPDEAIKFYKLEE